MKFHWTPEPFGFALRDNNANARAIVVRGSGEHAPGFYGSILASGLPESGPFKARQDAADWVTKMCVQLGHLPADSEFTELPIITRGKRAA